MKFLYQFHMLQFPLLPILVGCYICFEILNIFAHKKLSLLCVGLKGVIRPLLCISPAVLALHSLCASWPEM